ncbi:MAG: hypothetical protein ACK4UR_00235 [Caldimicrobium sp.]
MFLTIIKSTPLLKLLFKGRERDFLIFLQDQLEKNFQKKEAFLFEVEPEKLLKLNEIIFTVREDFKSEILSAPLPVSFYLVPEENLKEPSEALRPGRIYFYETLKGKILEVLEKKKIFFKTEPYDKEIYELILPSTVEAKLLFPFKDIFFLPFEKRCFFCQSHLHETSYCPGLDVSDTFQKFRELLSFPLEEIAENLYRDFKQKRIKESFFDYFYVRHFYLFPSFLKILFYLPEEIENWPQLLGNISLPVRGGELYLALEDLLYKRWKQVEMRIKNLEDDFRVELLNIMLSLLKEDYPKALYHIERALTFVKTPFLISYLLFYKGYLLYYLKDIYSAEDHFKLALKEDASCFPAFYFLHLLLYEEEQAPEKVFPFFTHPFHIYQAFLEPQFIKHELELEKSLDRAIATLREEAVKRLKEAEDKFHSLKEVMGEEEKREYEERLKEIRNNTYKGGVALIELANKKALELALELSGFLLSKIKKFKKELEKFKNFYSSVFNFWRNYPYKEEDIYFGQILSKSGVILNRLNKRLLRKNLSKEIKFITKEIEQLRSYMEDLLKLKPELERKWKFRRKLSKFLKRFSIAEGFLVLIYLFPLFYSEVNLLGRFQNFYTFLILSCILLLLVLFSLQLEKD